MTPEHRAGTWWRPWYAPIVVAVALIADYGSPAEMWTAVLPLVFMAFLLSFRERVAALAVLLLSSWIGLPLAAGVVRGVDAARGVHRLYVVHVTAQALDVDEDLSHCDPGTHVTRLEIDGRRPLADFETGVAVTFATAYNLFAGTSIEKDCHPATTPPAIPTGLYDRVTP